MKKSGIAGVGIFARDVSYGLDYSFLLELELGWEMSGQDLIKSCVVLKVFLK